MIGAPKGTFPGGLDIVDPLLPAENNTGLIYQCQLGNDVCEGVRGDVDLYIGDSITDDITNAVESYSFDSNNYFPAAISEGRLFDQARKCVCMYVRT